MSRLSGLTGSRQRLLLGGVVGLAVVIVLVVVLAGGGGEKQDPTEVDLGKVGMKLHAPTTWRRTVTDDSVDLRSPDSTIVLALSSPVAGREPKRVKQALERQLRSRYKPATITAEGQGKLGRRKVASFQLNGRLGDRVVTVVALVAATAKRTYVATLFTGRPSARSAREAKAILRSVELFKPTA